MPGPLQVQAFWDRPRGVTLDTQQRLMSEGFTGLMLDAPARVPIGKRATLPLMGVHAQTLREALALSLREALVVTAVNLETNHVRVGRAFEHKPLMTPPEAPADPGEGVAMCAFEVDLRARLDLPWQAGTWLVTGLLRERASNRLTVKLEAGGPAGFQDPVAAAWMARQRRPRYPQAISPRPAPGQPLPDYRPRPDSPPVPEQPGIALAVPRLVKDGDDATAVLRGSFRLPALEREVVKPEDPADAALLATLDAERGAQALLDGAAWQDPGDPQATAVIPITLVVTGARRPGPTVLRLQVPSYDPVGKVMTGHFALDLRQALGWDRLAEQTSFIYALSGAALGGPAPIAVVDPRYLA